MPRLRRAHAVGAAAAVAAGLACGLAGAGAWAPVDYRIRVVAPVDAAGAPTRTRASVGVPFRLRIELSTDRPAGVAAVSYDMFLPTDVSIPLRSDRVRRGVVTSRCLRVCAVGWDTTRRRSLSVYYTLVPPGPGRFIVAARLVSTNGADAVPENNAATTTIAVGPARLLLGVPELPTGAPLAGRSFALTLSVRRDGAGVLPASAACRASVGARRLTGSVDRARGRVRCSWRVPDGTSGEILRTTVTAEAGAARGSASWSYVIRTPR